MGNINQSVKKFDKVYVNTTKKNINKDKFLKVYFGKIANSLLIDLKGEYKGEVYEYKDSNNEKVYAFGGYIGKDLQLVKIILTPEGKFKKVEVIIREGTQIISVGYEYNSKTINSYKRLPNNTNNLIKQIESKRVKK